MMRGMYLRDSRVVDFSMRRGKRISFCLLIQDVPGAITERRKFSIMAWPPTSTYGHNCESQNRIRLDLLAGVRSSQQTDMRRIVPCQVFR